MRRTLLCACLLGLWSCLYGGLAQAREWLVVGTSFPQVYEQNAAGDFTGLAPSVLRQLAAEREARFAFAEEPFYQDRIVFYARRNHEPAWDGDYARLRGKRIAVVRGWIYGSQFEEVRGRLRPVTVETVRNGLRMLQAGRIDLLASNQRNTRPHMLALGLEEQIGELIPLIDVQRGFFAFPRDDAHAELRQRFDRAFERLVESGQLARLAAPLGVSVP
jgi:polar amino acid transport system substrate-binding protein